MNEMKSYFVISILMLLVSSAFALAHAAPDDFSYAALQEDKSDVEVDTSSLDILEPVFDDENVQFVQQILLPNQNQLTQQRITNEFYYIILLSAVALISLFVVLNFLKNHGQCPRDIVNAAGLILIIFGTIILVLVVDTTEQLTAAIGVLGAIAGYLFGTIQSDKQAKTG